MSKSTARVSHDRAEEADVDDSLRHMRGHP